MSVLNVSFDKISLLKTASFPTVCKGIKEARGRGEKG